MADTDTDITAAQLLVIGAGPTGLAAAWRLARAGRAVTVVDAMPEPGGLCRTLSWGDLRFDIGGHRFHTAFPDVHDMVMQVAADELIEVERKSRIHLGGQRFLDFPPTVGDTLAKVPAVGISAGLHSVGGMVAGVDPEPPADLRDYFMRQFGGALYDLVFGDYTEKVWGLRPEAISPDWGAARVGGLSLGGLLRQALGLGRGGARSVETFLYPADGYGRIFLRMAADIEAHGGRVLCGHRVLAIETPAEGPVRLRCSTADGEVELSARRVLSTMPLAPMVELLQPAPRPETLQAVRQLSYRALALVVLDLDGDDPISDDTWLYFPHASTPFCRLHEPTNWSRQLAPSGRSHVVVEYFLGVEDAAWKQPDEVLAQQVMDGLATAGLLDPGRVRDQQVLRFSRAYPIYDAAYAQTLAQVEAELDSRPGLLRAGRSGAFLYLSSDECMRHGLVAAERILACDPATQAHGEDELVLLLQPGLEPDEGAVARLERALERRAGDLVCGSLAATDGASALVRADQLHAPEARTWPGLALVRRSAWQAAGGDDDRSGPAVQQVLARIAARPDRVLLREPRATARATPAWWASLPAGSARWTALGVEPPDLRRRLASAGLWGLVGSSAASMAACSGQGVGLLAGLPLVLGAGFLLLSLPGWRTLSRAGKLDPVALLSRSLRWR